MILVTCPLLTTLSVSTKKQKSLEVAFRCCLSLTLVAELPLEPLDAVAAAVVRAASPVAVAVLDLALRVAQLALLPLPARLAHALPRDVGTVRVAQQRAHPCNVEDFLKEKDQRMLHGRRKNFYLFLRKGVRTGLG